MVHSRLHVATSTLDPIFERIRALNGVPDAFPPEVIAAASAAAARGPDAGAAEVERPQRVDRRDLELVSIDPEGSRDLDQAVHVERRGSGYRFSYAIADVASWVAPGDPVDLEARGRGVTVYCPDRRLPLHPPELSEGAASLFAGGDRPALLWTIDLDQRGTVTDASVERALVTNREALSYAEAQRRLDGGETHASLRAIEEFGRLRVEREVARGGISLQLPEQVVEQHGDNYSIHYEAGSPIETWNAQLSLCCGMVAADLMIAAGTGVLRTLPDAGADTVEELRRQAEALGAPWPAGSTYAAWVRSLRPDTAAGAALLSTAARSFRGAGYLAFDGNLPEEHRHAAIAAPYAHVTAPIRRLVDRFAAEFALAASSGRPAPRWAHEALDSLPALMGEGGRRAAAVDRAVIDVVEAATLASRVGETFDAVVTSTVGTTARVQLREPAVIAAFDTDGHRPRRPGDDVRLLLTAADVERGALSFDPV